MQLLTVYLPGSSAAGRVAMSDDKDILRFIFRKRFVWHKVGHFRLADKEKWSKNNLSFSLIIT